MRRVAVLVLVAALAVAAAAWWGGSDGDGRADEAPRSVGVAPGPPSSQELKELPVGLYLTQGPARGDLGFIDHAVIGVHWSELEPSDDDFTGAAWGQIERALRDHPAYRFRLRVGAGRFAPEWVKALEGGCVDVSQPASGLVACVPRFWTNAYLDEYIELMAEVARRYDDEPRLLDVVNSACTTMWAEPFIRAGDDGGSNARLWEAGLNESSDRLCLRRSTRAMARLFERTRISLATHLQWQIVTAEGLDPSWAKQRNLLNNLLDLFGEELVIQNNGLGGDEGCARRESVEDATDMWCWIAALPYPKGFQTEGDRKLASEGHDVLDAVRRALGMGACFVEHNAFGDQPGVARALDARLARNCSAPT